MSATPGRTRTRRLAIGAGIATATFVALAEPAAAHNAPAGSLPVPPWLLAYLGASLVLGTAVALRAAWPRPRLHGFVAVTAEDDGGGHADQSAPGRATRLPALGQLAGLVVYVLCIVAAIVGPDTAAANITPVAVFIAWWIGLPLACLLLGDVMRRINPFLAVVTLIGGSDDGESRPERPTPPGWTAAAFLGVFVWFFVAYHEPGSPRAVAVLLIAYALAAIGLGLRFGTRWLATGEAFGALSAGVALLSPWRRRVAPPPGLAALAIVWIGSTAFDGFTSTPFWGDILGTSQEWQRTFLNTVGLVWLTAIVAGVYLGAQRIARGRAGDDAEERDLVDELGVALVPLALGWFLAHDITLALLEGQNLRALISDPIGRGWDLFGTIDSTIRYTVSQEPWVRWAQIGMLAVGHVVAVVVGHDTALHHTSPRRAMQVTWGLALAASASAVASALVVLG